MASSIKPQPDTDDLEDFTLTKTEERNNEEQQSMVT